MGVGGWVSAFGFVVAAAQMEVCCSCNPQKLVSRTSPLCPVPVLEGRFSASTTRLNSSPLLAMPAVWGPVADSCCGRWLQQLVSFFC